MFNNNKIKIAMLEMSQQNKAILAFYFDRAGKRLYDVVTDKDAADALIIDYDQFGAKEHVSEILEMRKVPILLISIKEQDIPSTIWLAKPLSADALSKAAESVNEMFVTIAEEVKQEAEAAKENANNDASSKLEEKTENSTDSNDEVSATETANIETDDDADAVFADLLDLELDESDAVEEAVQSVDTLERDDLIDLSLDLDEEIAEQAELEIGEFDLDKTEATNTQSSTTDSNALGAGLAIAGASVAATAAKGLETALTADDDFDLEMLEEDVTEQTPINKDTSDNKESTATQEPDFEDDEDVSLLLDSLLEEGADEHHNDTTSESTQDEALALDEGDSFLEDLLLDDDFEAPNDDPSAEKEDTSETIDVLQSVDSKLQENLDNLHQELGSEEEANADDEADDSLLFDENFTLHEDTEASTEDVFAQTLEMGYDEAQTSNGLQNAEAEEDLSLELETDQYSKISEKESEADRIGSLSDDFLDFDFEQNPSAETEVVEEASVGDDFELSLLDEDIEEAAEESNDDVDIDLDSLLEEHSNEITDDADAEETLTLDDSGTEEALSIDLNDDSIEGLDLSEDQEQEVIEEAANVMEQLEELHDAEADDDFSDLDDELNDIDLQSLLNEVREEADRNAQTEEHFDENGQKQYEQTNAEKRWIQLCGNEVSVSNQKEAEKIMFDQEQYLLGHFLSQLKSTQGEEQLFRIKYKDLIIVIDHSQRKIYCNKPINDDDFATVCANEIESNTLKVHDLDYSEEKLYRSKISKNQNRTHSFESFIWTMSLLTSRGRLPKGTTLTRTVGLKTWPNLTRLELMPHAMNIAAVFSKHPGNLIEIPNWLNIHQKYIFAFYNAALALEMIEFDAVKAKKSGFSFGSKSSKKKSEERGFFGRLLKRLKS